MRKILSIIAINLMFITLSFAQTTLYSDDFEALTAGEAFVAQANQTWWRTWTPGSTSEDAVVSTDYAHSGVNSVVFSQYNDVILKFGDRASGEYEISFWVYVGAGQGGAYFNLQKWEEPGNEWAFNCVFNDDGTGNLQYSGDDHAFTYTTDAWVEIKNVVNLDDDVYKMYIDGTLTDTHQYSVTALGGSGEDRLGCIDFYGDTGMNFYIDDVSVIENIASTPPAASLDVTEITSDGTATSELNLENTGVEDLYFSIYPTYPQAASKAVNNATENSSIQLGSFDKGAKDNFDLTFVNGDIGFFTFSSPGVRTMKEVIKFTPEQLNTFGAIGAELNSVVCYVGENQLDGNPITDFTLVVYDRESLLSPGPGTVLEEVPFTPSAEYDQTVVNLDTPIYIDGRDLWFGFKYTDPGISATDTVFALSYDGNAGGMVEGSNWLSLGVGWRSDVGGNLGLIGLASGTPISTWLSVSPSNGAITANNTEAVTVSFDLAGLTSGTYTANLAVATNDPSNPFFDIPVTLDAVGIEDIASAGVMTYPNPANDMLNIVSNNVILNITATSITGRQVYNVSPNTKKQEVNLSTLSTGVYIFTIETANQTITRKIVVE